MTTIFVAFGAAVAGLVSAFAVCWLICFGPSHIINFFRNTTQTGNSSPRKSP
jgi:hypothetical protein